MPDSNECGFQQDCSLTFAGTPKPLFPLTGYREARNRQQYDVAPDGQHFLMIKDFASTAPPDVVYVEHWLEELVGKMKAKR